MYAAEAELSLTQIAWDLNPVVRFRIPKISLILAFTSLAMNSVAFSQVERAAVTQIEHNVCNGPVVINSNCTGVAYPPITDSIFDQFLFLTERHSEVYRAIRANDIVRAQRILHDEINNLGGTADTHLLLANLNVLDGRFEEANRNLVAARGLFPGDRRVSILIESIDDAGTGRLSRIIAANREIAESTSNPVVAYRALDYLSTRRPLDIRSLLRSSLIYVDCEEGREPTTTFVGRRLVRPVPIDVAESAEGQISQIRTRSCDDHVDNSSVVENELRLATERLNEILPLARVTGRDRAFLNMATALQGIRSTLAFHIGQTTQDSGLQELLTSASSLDASIACVNANNYYIELNLGDLGGQGGIDDLGRQILQMCDQKILELSSGPLHPYFLGVRANLEILTLSYLQIRIMSLNSREPSKDDWQSIWQIVSNSSLEFELLRSMAGIVAILAAEKTGLDGAVSGLSPTPRQLALRVHRRMARNSEIEIAFRRQLCDLHIVTRRCIID